MKLVLVMLFVLVFCGGNGAGILLGFLVWKVTGRALPAVLLLLAVTIGFFALAMLLVSRLLKGIAKDAAQASQTHDDASELKGSEMK